MTRGMRLGAAVALVLFAVTGGAVPMGARGVAWGGGGWTNPYITDGLIAMWDGEWNAGPGVHDATATVWKDIVGSRDFSLSSGCSFGDYEIIISGQTTYLNVPFTSADASGLSAYTVEILNKGTFGTSGTLNGVFQISGRGILTTSSGRSCRFSSSTLNFNAGKLSLWELDSVTVDESKALKIYANSVAKGSGTAVALGANTSNGITVNRRESYTQYGCGELRVRCLRIYSRALTAEEIAHNYAVDKARFGLP